MTEHTLAHTQTQLTLLQEKNGCCRITIFHYPCALRIYTAAWLAHISAAVFNLIPKCDLFIGINAQARKLQKSRSRVTSTLIERTMGRSHKLWRSKSEMDLLDSDKTETKQDVDHDECPKDLNQASVPSHKQPQTSPEQSHIQSLAAPSEGDGGSQTKTETLCPSRPGGEREAEESEREETESSGDNTTQYSIHPPHDCPYLLLLQGCSPAQVSHSDSHPRRSSVAWISIKLSVWTDIVLNQSGCRAKIKSNHQV